MKKKKADRPNKVYVDYTVEELKRLKYWFEGFGAAGGKLPQCVRDDMFNPLHKAIRLMQDHVETKD
jgi:hypothetical protein